MTFSKVVALIVFGFALVGFGGDAEACTWNDKPTLAAAVGQNGTVRYAEATYKLDREAEGAYYFSGTWVWLDTNVVRPIALVANEENWEVNFIDTKEAFSGYGEGHRTEMFTGLTYWGITLNQPVRAMVLELSPDSPRSPTNLTQIVVSCAKPEE